MGGSGASSCAGTWREVIHDWGEGRLRRRSVCGYMLPHAAANAQADLLEALLQNGADPNARDYGGGTALHRAVSSLQFYGISWCPWEAWYAAQHRNVALLIRYKADVNARMPSGRTALDMAESSSVRQLLRSHGAKTGAELDAEGKR